MCNLASLYFENDIHISQGMDLINEALEIYPESSAYIQSKGWGLYKQGKYEDSLELLEKSWDLKYFYNHELYLNIQEVKQAIAKQRSEQ
jgi:tetratricopeptide (TPR) repeat protein